jgi:hypothetical protein
MITIKEKKVPSNTIVVEAPKGRGHMPPPSRKFKDKRRKLLDRFIKESFNG